MAEQKLFVLAKEFVKEENEDELASVDVCGLVSSMREAKAWSAGNGHRVYEVEVDGEIKPEGLLEFEF